MIDISHEVLNEALVARAAFVQAGQFGTGAPALRAPAGIGPGTPPVAAVPPVPTGIPASAPAG